MRARSVVRRIPKRSLQSVLLTPEVKDVAANARVAVGERGERSYSHWRRPNAGKSPVVGDGDRRCNRALVRANGRFPSRPETVRGSHPLRGERSVENVALGLS
jgi:hypothetical protein